MKILSLLLIFLFNSLSYATVPKACQDKYEATFNQKCKGPWGPATLCPIEYDKFASNCSNSYHQNLDSRIKDVPFSMLRIACENKIKPDCEKNWRSKYCYDQYVICLDKLMKSPKYGPSKLCPKEFAKMSSSCMNGKANQSDVDLKNFSHYCPTIEKAADAARTKCAQGVKRGDQVGICGECKVHQILVNVNGEFVAKDWSGFSVVLEGKFLKKIGTAEACKDDADLVAKCKLSESNTDCVKHDSATGVCTECKVGFELSGKDCKKCEGAKVSDGKNACSDCSAGTSPADDHSSCRADEVIPEIPTCVWLEHSVARVKSECETCKLRSAICAGRMYCTKAKAKDGTITEEKVSNVICKPIITGTITAGTEGAIEQYSCPTKVEDCRDDKTKADYFEFSKEERGDTNFSETVKKN